MKLEVGRKYKIKMIGWVDRDSGKREELEININAEYIEIEKVEKLVGGGVEVFVQMELQKNKRERVKRKIIDWIEKI